VRTEERGFKVMTEEIKVRTKVGDQGKGIGDW
jgi:hypothetical protein